MNDEPPVLPEPKRAPAPRWPWIVAVSIAALVVCALAGVLVLARLSHRGSQSQAPQVATRTAATVTVAPDESLPEALPDLPPPPPDFSSTNTVTILLGQEQPEDGIKHLANEADGRTTIETVDGVPCRHLDRRKPGQMSFGYVYFVLDPTFKRNERMPVRIEVEYWFSNPGYLRLQYDAMEGETHHSYKSAVATGAQAVRWGTGIEFMRLRATNAWQTATFRIKDGAFLNSQNGGADFRLEVTPAEVYVRRVSVTREAGEEPKQ